MIKSFRHKALGQLFGGNPKGINADLRAKAENILFVLDSATDPQSLNLPGFNLHELKGDRRGVWSVTVKKNWRITFRFEGSDAIDVDFEDYH